MWEQKIPCFFYFIHLFLSQVQKLEDSEGFRFRVRPVDCHVKNLVQSAEEKIDMPRTSLCLCEKSRPILRWSNLRKVRSTSSHYFVKKASVLYQCNYLCTGLDEYKTAVIFLPLWQKLLKTPFLNWTQGMYWFMHQTSLIKVMY